MEHNYVPYLKVVLFSNLDSLHSPASVASSIILGSPVQDHDAGHRCVSLSPDYHESAVLAHGSTLFLGCRNGRVLKVSSVESHDHNDD